MNVKRVCRKCGVCCKTKTGPIVLPRDISPMCIALNITKEEFLTKFCNEVKAHIKDKAISIYYIKTLEKKCVFLQENNLCLIYNNRPYQCKNAPFEFMAQYKFWKHMKCIREDDFINCDTLEKDKNVLKEILTRGYY